MDTQMDRWIQTDSHTYIHTDRQSYIQTVIHTYIQTDQQTDGQTSLFGVILTIFMMIMCLLYS